MKPTIYLFLSIILGGCTSSPETIFIPEGQISLEPAASFYELIYTPHHGTQDVWPLDYPVNAFHVGDISNDGSSNILVLVEKTTRFDTVVRQRPFVFKLVDGKIRPLWLGSRLGGHIQNIEVIQQNDTTFVVTYGQVKNGELRYTKFLWDHFGFKFISYSDIPYESR